VPVNAEFTKTRPLAIGNPGGEPIHVIAEHYGRARLHEEMWISGDGAEEAIDAGLYSRLDGDTGGVDPPATPPVVDAELPELTIPVDDD
jgi:hypothetical protein